MTLNGVMALILRFSPPNSIALQDDYVAVVEDNIVSQQAKHFKVKINILKIIIKKYPCRWYQNYIHKILIHSYLSYISN